MKILVIRAVADLVLVRPVSDFIGHIAIFFSKKGGEVWQASAAFRGLAPGEGKK
jgi:hypothetical protein